MGRKRKKRGVMANTIIFPTTNLKRAIIKNNKMYFYTALCARSRMSTISSIALSIAPTPGTNFHTAWT